VIVVANYCYLLFMAHVLDPHPGDRTLTQTVL